MATPTRSQRLAIVLNLAARDKEKAAQAFEQARQTHLQEQHKLQQLADYYREYETGFAANTGMRVDQLIKQRRFLQQLADAQKQQQGVIRNAENLLENKRAAWQMAHLKHKNLADLITRYRAEEDAALSKKEQKMLDEWFQQQTARS